MSFTIFTYNGKVVVGIACDKTLVPDHEPIFDGFAVAFDRLLAATPGRHPLNGQLLFGEPPASSFQFD